MAALRSIYCNSLQTDATVFSIANRDAKAADFRHFRGLRVRPGYVVKALADRMLRGADRVDAFDDAGNLIHPYTSAHVIGTHAIARGLGLSTPHFENKFLAGSLLAVSVESYRVPLPTGGTAYLLAMHVNSLTCAREILRSAGRQRMAEGAQAGPKAFDTFEK